MVSILYFLYLYAIPIKGLPINSSKCICLILIIINGYYWMKDYKMDVNKIKYEYPLILFIIGGISFSCILSIVHKTYQFNIAYAYFLLLFEDLFGTLLFFNYMNHSKNKQCFFDVFILSCFLQSLLIIAMYMSEDFRFWGYEFMGVDRYYLNQRYGGFRGLGFSGSVTYDLSTIQSVALNMIILKLFTCSRKSLIKYIVYFPFILFSVFVSGRTGFIGIGITLLLLIYAIIVKKNTNNYLLIIILSFEILSIYMVGAIVTPINIKESLDKVFAFAFELFNNLIQNKQFTTASTEILKKMYWMPSLITLLVGDGYYLNPLNLSQYYMGTDVGYMRHLLYYGIMGSMFLYGFYFVLFKRMLYLTKRYYSKVIFYWVAGLMIYYFMVHGKGDFLLGSRLGSKTIIGIYIMLSYNRKYKRRMSYETSVISHNVSI